MKIILITYVTPTPDNFKAASALSFHLCKYRPENAELEIYSFNANNVSENVVQHIGKELNANIHIVPTNKYINYLFKTHTVFLKNFLPYPFNYYNSLSLEIVEEINNKRPDAIWINGDFMLKVLKQFDGYKKVLTMPDCVCLYYNRLLKDDWCKQSWLKTLGNRIQAAKNKQLERNYPTKNTIYHLVGEADKQYLLNINKGLDAHFIRHPHYNYTDKKQISFSKPKIKILIAGQYNLYTFTAFNEVFPELCNYKEIVNDYSITFLGKGWDFAVKKLQAAGYETNQISFVDVYLDEIIKYDIQLTPISVGTGTKGKVLDALANGLLVMGTPYAMENIAVENNKSCLIYRNTTQLMSVLKEIPHQRSRYEAIAIEGRKCVLTEHNREKISKELFRLFSRV